MGNAPPSPGPVRRDPPLAPGPGQLRTARRELLPGRTETPSPPLRRVDALPSADERPLTGRRREHDVRDQRPRQVAVGAAVQMKNPRRRGQSCHIDGV